MNEARKKVLEIYRQNYKLLREAGYDSTFCTENKKSAKDIIQKFIEEIRNVR